MILDQRQELDRGQQPKLRVLPANQRLHPHHAPAAHVDLGLVVEDELVLLQRLANALQALVASTHDAILSCIEEMVAVLAQQLGLVHGLVGLAQQLVGVYDFVLRIESHPQACRHLHPVVVYRHLLCRRLEQALEQRQAGPDLGQVHHHCHELIAAYACQGVTLTQHVIHAPGHRHQQAVSGIMAVAVVDALEAVQIERHHRQPRFAPQRLRHALLQAVGQQTAVGQLSQGIVVSHLLELALMGFLRGYVGKQADITQRLPRAVTYGADGQLLDEQLAVLAPVPYLTRPMPLDEQRRPHLRIELRRLPARTQDARILPDQLLTRIAGQATKSIIDSQNAATGIGDRHPFAGMGKHHRQLLELGVRAQQGISLLLQAGLGQLTPADLGRQRLLVALQVFGMATEADKGKHPQRQRQRKDRQPKQEERGRDLPVDFRLRPQDEHRQRGGAYRRAQRKERRIHQRCTARRSGRHDPALGQCDQSFYKRRIKLDALPGSHIGHHSGHEPAVGADEQFQVVPAGGQRIIDQRRCHALQGAHRHHAAAKLTAKDHRRTHTEELAISDDFKTGCGLLATRDHGGIKLARRRHLLPALVEESHGAEHLTRAQACVLDLARQVPVDVIQAKVQSIALGHAQGAIDEVIVDRPRLGARHHVTLALCQKIHHLRCAVRAISEQTAVDRIAQQGFGREQAGQQHGRVDGDERDHKPRPVRPVRSACAVGVWPHRQLSRSLRRTRGSSAGCRGSNGRRARRSGRHA